jgi:alkanesulfonate monooxygenase SsuD/methylene tetrahydromethanopterin reductase-like flavin-dependent oxidoreductase (luciferase family)
MVMATKSVEVFAGRDKFVNSYRGSPEQVVDGWRHFGFAPAEGESDADTGRRHAESLLEVLTGEGFAAPSPRPMFPNPPGLLRVEPHSEGLRERIWCGSGSTATGIWAAKLGMNLQSSTLKDDESGKPVHVQQAVPFDLYRQAWQEAGHEREPRVSVSRRIFALTDERDLVKACRMGLAFFHRGTGIRCHRVICQGFTPAVDLDPDGCRNHG